MNRTFYFLFILIIFCSPIFAQTEENFRVGVFLGMTGDTSSFGISSLLAIKMAVDEINSKGGGTRKTTMNNPHSANKPVVILKLQSPDFIFHSIVQP